MSILGRLPSWGVKAKISRVLHVFWRCVWVRLSLGVLVVLLVFVFGIEVGTGQINLIFWGPNYNRNLPGQLDYASLTEEYDVLKQNYNGQLTTTQLMNGMEEGLADATGDPYTEYFTASEAKQFNSELNNTFSGIGVELGQNSQGQPDVVVAIEGYPAYKAGIKSQDVIISINGKSTANMSEEQVADAIRGPQGTKVTLGILRGGNQMLTFTIVRGNVQAPSVTTKILPGNIGYMQISTFANDTSDLAQKAANQFKQDKVKGIILDLRDNPGGYLNAAINVSSLWLPSSDTVVSEQGTIGDETYSATGDDVLNGIPTVVLIDGGSASASEITAGALHDNKAAWLIGTKSYGKGVVQDIFNLSDGGELKVTVASWYRPNGQNINKKGITPDQVVNESSSSTTDTQLTAAESYLATH